MLFATEMHLQQLLDWWYFVHEGMFPIAAFSSSSIGRYKEETEEASATRIRSVLVLGLHLDRRSEDSKYCH